MLKVMMSIQLLLATAQAGAADRDKTGTNAVRNPIPTPYPLRILAVPDARSLGAERGNRTPHTPRSNSSAGSAGARVVSPTSSIRTVTSGCWM